MTLPAAIFDWIETGRFEAVEDDWLAHADTEPLDLDYFVEVARALAGARQRDRAETLLELIDEDLQEAGSWAQHLDLLRRVGELTHLATSLHPEILSGLRQLYQGFPSLEILMDHVGLLRAVDDLPKTWRKVESLQQLLQYDVGAIVWMQGKGAGTVVEVNLELESFKIDFERQAGIRVGFVAAGKVLRVLPPGHILRRKLEEPDRLHEIKKNEPGELLITVLKSYEKPRTAAEIRRALAGIVAEKEWSGWWAAARKDPRVLGAGGHGRQAYTWARSGEDAQDEVRQEFAAADTRERMALFRNNAGRSPTLKEEMAGSLLNLAATVTNSEPALALELHFLLEREGVDLSALPWTPESLVTDVDHPVPVLAKLKDRTHRQRVLEIIARCRGDWLELYDETMRREEDPRLLTFLAGAILEAAPDRLRPFLDEVTAQPRKRPAAFAWLAENATSLRMVDERNPLRLLQQILDVSRHREFSRFRSRLEKLYESGGAVSKLLSRLEEDQATLAEQAIHRAPLEEYLRTALINALHMRFPFLRQADETPLYATSAAIDKRRSDLKHLLEVDIPANRKAIEEARALGDLSENFEYKAARQRHEYLSARVTSLDRDLARVRSFEVPSQQPSEVRIGCEIELHTDGEAPRILTVLGPWESQPDRGIVSYESELGGRLLGVGLGETVVIEGRSYEVKSIRLCSPEILS